MLHFLMEQIGERCDLRVRRGWEEFLELLTNYGAVRFIPGIH